MGEFGRLLSAVASTKSRWPEWRSWASSQSKGHSVFRATPAAAVMVSGCPRGRRQSEVPNWPIYQFSWGSSLNQMGVAQQKKW